MRYAPTADYVLPLYDSPSMARLIVDHLPVRFTARDLVQLFAAYGTVLSAEVVRTGLGQSVRFGYVEMSTEEESRQAMEALNGYVIDGQSLHIAKADGA